MRIDDGAEGLPHWAQIAQVPRNHIMGSVSLHQGWRKRASGYRYIRSFR